MAAQKGNKYALGNSGGRPIEWNELEKNKAIDKITELILQGISINEILKKEGMPCPFTFYKWLKENEELANNYALAKEINADMMFNDIIYIADDSSNDDTAFTGINHVHRDRLRIDSRKWVASKLAPKKYGDKLEIEGSINCEIDFTK